MLGALSALSAAGLVRLGERGWATSHDLVRETVAADLAEADRAQLHARLAAALAGADADPAELAEHLAGAGDAEAAARQYAAAAGQRVDGADDAGVAELVDAGLPSPTAASRATGCWRCGHSCGPGAATCPAPGRTCGRR